MKPDPKPARRLVNPELVRQFKRDNPHSVISGYGPVVAHHAVSRRQGGSDCIENLIALTFIEHDLFHSGGAAQRRVIGRSIRSAMSEANVAYVLEMKGREYLDRLYPAP